MQGKLDEVSYDVISHIGILATYQTGWTKELNIVSWNGGMAKYDIRDWNEPHTQMSRGITLHKEEARKLMELLKDRFKGFDAEPRRKYYRSRKPVDDSAAPIDGGAVERDRIAYIGQPELEEEPTQLTVELPVEGTTEPAEETCTERTEAAVNDRPESHEELRAEEVPDEAMTDDELLMEEAEAVPF